MEVDLEIETLLIGIHKFAENLCKIISTDKRTTLLSPVSIHSVLTLLSQDPYLLRNKEILSGLLSIDVNKANICYKHVLSLLNSIDNRNFLLTNKVFLKDRCELEELFRTRLLNDFLYNLNSLSFEETDAAVELINNLIKEGTCNKAKDLINTSDVSDKTYLTLLNSMYFNDKWAKPFTECIPGTFHVNETDTVQVEMMKIKSEFYYKDDFFNARKVLQLPFVNNDISLIVILPNSGSKFGLFDTFHGYDVTSITDDMSLQEVDVSLPKFKIEDMLELNKFINEMGLESILSANFHGMTHDEEIILNKLQQKVFIDVNQDGLEAASGMVCSLDKADAKKILPKNGLVVYEMNIKTDISNRFAKTKIMWKVKNVEKYTNEATFRVILNETAFITGFVMEIEGKSYKSYIKEKEQAKAIYKEAVAQGKSAGLVEAKTRDSKEFSVSINLEPDFVAVFNLTYEEMLQRIHDQYELVVNICPGQIVDNLNVEVDIMETRPLKFVKTPPLRSGKEIGNVDEKCLDPLSKIQMINAKTASIKFNPDQKRQRLMAHNLETDPSYGLSGQFVVQYDVERDPQDGQVLLQDGYFVHFFAPNDLDPLPKHVVFVLDTSGSMGGRKIIQLKDAMLSILQEIRKDDMINIVEFNSDVFLWDINSQRSTLVPALKTVEDFQNPFDKLSKMNLPGVTYANEETLIKAKDVVLKMNAFGGTYIIGGLATALYLVKFAQDKNVKKNEKHQSIIVFLTDGEPNVGMSSTHQIVDTVTRLNLKYNKVPIFSLSFGRGADKNFLRKLSLKNQGFSRHIYEAADASLQLQEFYKQISSPLLADIQFKYDSEVEDVTKTCFPIYFRGSELIVAGRYTEPSFPTAINCRGPRGPIIITSVIERPVTSLERLWAYLTVKQLLDERETVDDKTDLTNKATFLALKYSFVTDVTSLVVVKPDDTSTLDDSANKPDQGVSAFRTYSGGPRRKFVACMRSSNTTFGARAAQQMPFGSSNSTSFGAPTAQGLLFGSSNTTSFGAPAAQQMPFGSSNTTSFGAPAAQQMPFGSSNSTSFGAPTAQGLLFGSSNTTSFGAPAAQQIPFGSSNLTSFGAPTAQGLLFGSSNTTSFGAPAAQQMPFGSSNTTSFGAPAAQQMPFGSSNTTSFGAPAAQQMPFGSSNTTSFGAPAAQQIPFGSSNTTSFGASAAQQMPFGSSNTTSFGAPAAQQIPFGSSNTTSFGAPAAQQIPFGSSNTTSFGASAAQQIPFGSSNTTSFGAPTAQQMPFGSSNSTGFGAPAAQGLLFGSSNATAFGAPAAQQMPFGSSDTTGFHIPRVEGLSLEDPFSVEKKKPIEFVADRPFIILLQSKKENKTVILFKGCVSKPTY